MRKKAYESEPVKFSMTPEKYMKGVRDMLYVMPNPNIYNTEKYNAKKLVFEPQYEKIFNDVVNHLSKTNFGQKFPDEYNALSKGHNSVDILNFIKLVNSLSDKAIVEQSGLNLDLQIMTEYAKQASGLLKSISNSALPLDIAMKHVGSDEKAYKAPIQNGDLVNYLPASKFILKADRETIKKYGVVKDNYLHKAQNRIEWDLRASYITKNHILLLDMLAANNWERPIYFASTVGNSQYLNLEDYFQLEGLAYRIVPVKSTDSDYMTEGTVNTDILYNNLMNKFVWGGLDTEADKIYLDENNRRFVINYKGTFRALVKQLIVEDKNDLAEKALDKCFHLFPNKIASFGYYDLLLAEQYIQIGKKEKAMEIINTVADNFKQNLVYYTSLNDKYLPGLASEIERTSALYSELVNVLVKNKEMEAAKQIASDGYTIVETRFKFNQTISTLSEENQQRWYAGLPGYQKALLNLEFTLEKFSGN